MATKIAIANQKGGIGKTTTTLCIADAMKYCGFNTLVVDMDPQCNSTIEYISDINDPSTKLPTIYDVFNDAVDIKETIIETERGPILPGDMNLPEIESKISAKIDRYSVMHDKIKTIEDNYDFILFDTPPTLGLWMINALAAADGCICPIAADRFAIEGLGLLIKTIDDVRHHLNPELRIYGVLLNNYNQTKALDRDTWLNLPTLAERMDFHVFERPIRTCQEIRKSQAIGKSLFQTAPECNAAIDYANTIKELLSIIEEG